MDQQTGKRVQIEYFALLREQSGMSSETLTTRARTLAELYGELKALHGFTLPLDRMRVAVNDRFEEWDQPVNEQDCIIFIPPVAGG